jgi:hypothetical protein
VKMFFLLSLLVFSFSSFGFGTKFKIPKQKRAYYSFKEACVRLGFSETLLVDAIGVRALNCMGEKVQLADICLKNKKFKIEPFVRAYLDLTNKKVVCQYGKQALLTLSCEHDKTRRFCAAPKKSCARFQKKFANELKLSHHSRLFKGNQELLHCYYSYSKNDKKEEIDLLDIPQELTF